MNDLYLPTTTTVPSLEPSDKFPLADLELGANLVEAVGAVQKGGKEVWFFFLPLFFRRLLLGWVAAFCILAGVVILVLVVFLLAVVIAFPFPLGGGFGLFGVFAGAVGCPKFPAAATRAAAAAAAAPG